MYYIIVWVFKINFKFYFKTQSNLFLKPVYEKHNKLQIITSFAEESRSQIKNKVKECSHKISAIYCPVKRMLLWSMSKDFAQIKIYDIKNQYISQNIH